LGGVTLPKKLFITDCEGPLSVNDNAFELAGHFIPDGEKFFSEVSHYDDVLVEEVKRPNYNAGDTLKLIIPFLIAYGVDNQKIIDFSRENVMMVPGANETLSYVESTMPSFIVSTSYGQYIKALCDLTGFSFENTYFTQADLDKHVLSSVEKQRLMEIKDLVVNGVDFETMDKIFFEELPQMEIGKILLDVETVGGEGKKLAVEDILKKNDTTADSVMYVGDSITDVEPLKFAKENQGVSVSFNGNEFAINAADIAIISKNTIATSILIDLHSKFNSDYVRRFVEGYAIDPKRALFNFRVSFQLLEEFEEIFGPDLPIIELINDENREELIKKSLICRKELRGMSIGSLG
jgi:energy-converting hydrogenase A subunit R